MGKVGRPRHTDLTINEVVSWAMWRAKAPLKEIKEKTGITSDRGVYHRIHKVEEAIKEKFPIEDYKNACLLLYPVALESLHANLAKHDVPTTLFFMKNVIGFNDKITGEGIANSVFIIRPNGNGNGDEPEKDDKTKVLSGHLRL